MSRFLRAALFLTLFTARSRAEAQAAAVPRGWIGVAPAPLDSRLNRCLASTSNDWAVSLNASKDEIRVSRYRDTLGADTLSVSGGFLVGWNYGEFGGGVTFQPEAGEPDTLVQDNLRAFVRTRSGVRAIVGIAHLGTDRGAVYSLASHSSGSWQATRVAELGSAPLAVLPLPHDSLLILASRRIVLLLADNSVQVLATSDNWWPLYANSIVRDAQGNIIFGMRGAIATLSPTSGGYRERWYLPRPCRRREANSP